MCAPSKDEIDQLNTHDLLNERSLAAVGQTLARDTKGSPPTLLTSASATQVESVKSPYAPGAGDAKDMGSPCTFLHEATGRRSAAAYCVDERAGTLTVTAGPRQDGEPGLVCSVDAIEDIFVFDDGDDCFPPSVVARLQVGEKERLFRILYACQAGGGIRSMCVLEQSQARREALLEHLKSLKLALAAGSGC